MKDDDLINNAWLKFSEGLKFFENASFDNVFRNGFKAGWGAREDFDSQLLKLVQDGTKRSKYAWSAGGFYNAQDYKNEGAIQAAHEILNKLEEIAKMGKEK